MLWSWWKWSCDPPLKCDHPGGDWNLESWFMLIMRCVDSQSKVGFLGYSWWNLKIVEFLGDVILSDCADLSSSQKHGTSTSWKKQHICFVPGLWHLFWVSPENSAATPALAIPTKSPKKTLDSGKTSRETVKNKLRWHSCLFLGSWVHLRHLGDQKKQGPGVTTWYQPKQCTKFRTNHS